VAACQSRPRNPPRTAAATDERQRRVGDGVLAAAWRELRNPHGRSSSVTCDSHPRR
jgi:hypothetical protein